MTNPRIDFEVENEKRKMKQDFLVTEFKKEKFVEEIKKGLGDKIKKEPNKVHKKPSLLDKIKRMFL